ncbi:hypothetical protein CHH26_06770 [Qipengyuania flava]|uniref:oligosaccharide flippase family protein n=1 Tax=Qipengyuania flava TaxID=192812 RepID=UPI000B8C3395|nr:oligosaccharide flippase family protein [Qipengyuania flava]ASP29967.1 hypothetical protein CHH26_06770 [Qipengyuania flava]
MFLRKIASSNLVRNVFAVASGTALAQIVVVAFSPIITRIYGPEAFGLQGVFLSLVSIFSPLIALRYPMAIITAEDDDEALQLAQLSLVIASILASTLFAILFFFTEASASLLGAAELGNLIFFLPIALLSVAIQNVTDYKAARVAAFRLIGIVSVAQAVITNSFRAVGGLLSPVATVLIIITSFAPATHSAMLVLGSSKLRRRSGSATKRQIIALLKKYRDFAIYRAPTDFLNSASQAVPVILLSSFFSPTSAGFYVLTRSILNLPANILSAAVGNVVYARFGELKRNSLKLFPLLLKVTLSLMCLAPIIAGLAYFLAPTVFSFVFGQEWKEAGRYAQWMSLWLGVALANIPAVRVAPVIDSQRLLFFANGGLLAARILSIVLVAKNNGSALDAVISYSLVSLIGNLVLIFLLSRSCYICDNAMKKSHS